LGTAFWENDQRSTRHGNSCLPITVEENDDVKGWVGKPKRMRQVLWERRLLDPQVTYVSKIKKDDPNYDGKVE
jgi:hypothetical protein